jgi:prepilin-type processing-associated H-X9-DG protein
MYCPKCGTENPEGAQLCRSCSWVLTSISTVAPSPDAKTSGLAITSLVLGILSIFTLFLTALPAIIFGIVGLVKIEKSRGQLKGKGLAIAGIAVPIVMLPFVAMLMAIMMPALAQARFQAQRIVCANNLKQLGLATIMYANDNNSKYPTSDKWCDLIEQYHKNDKLYVCPSAEQGKCNYAINKNLPEYSTLSKRASELVLLFESKPGWNRSGGPELLTTENHRGEGCNVVFCDGHVEFVKTEDLNDLIWTAE